MSYFERVGGDGRAILAGMALFFGTIVTVVGVVEFSPHHPRAITVRHIAGHDAQDHEYSFFLVEANDRVQCFDDQDMTNAIDALEAGAKKIRQERDRRRPER